VTADPAVQLGMIPVAGFSVVPLASANRLVAAWGHELGPITRPFGAQSWVLDIDGEPVSVAVSVSTVSEHVAWTETRTEGEGDDTEVIVERRTMHRGQLVELGRLCSREPWANRVTLRLWREVAAPRWPYWTPTMAVSYSLNSRHDGQLYRFDGWTKAADDCGSSGGGAWSRKRYATDAVHGRKTLWLWRLS
jgi:hypothetical protein